MANTAYFKTTTHIKARQLLAKDSISSKTSSLRTALVASNVGGIAVEARSARLLLLLSFVRAVAGKVVGTVAA